MLCTFEQFVKERRYVTNVSETTVRWYWCSWKSSASLPFSEAVQISFQVSSSPTP
jgi:hypothetical protein